MHDFVFEYLVKINAPTHKTDVCVREDQRADDAAAHHVAVFPDFF
jgi:hypothetical protein